jgi:transposase
LKQLNDYRIDAYLRLIDSLDSEIKKVSKEIQSRAEKEDVTKLLVTITGIGYYSALFILSEISPIQIAENCLLGYERKERISCVAVKIFVIDH